MKTLIDGVHPTAEKMPMVREFDLSMLMAMVDDTTMADRLLKIPEAMLPTNIPIKEAMEMDRRNI